MTTETEFAPAKINLYLHVVGRRSDGYHLLDSLIAFAGVGDRLEGERADDLTLAIEGPMASALLPEVEDNIVLKAARALARAAGIRSGARLTLTKILPVASGIGGGSADAAAALRLLMRLWDVSLSAAELYDLALSLGADVPVCLAGRSAAMAGIGDSLRPTPVLPPVWLVLVNPRESLPTPDVFRSRRGVFSEHAPLEAAPATAEALVAALLDRRNDLTEAARQHVPAIDDVLAALSVTPGCLLARMSGSGATCFGLFGDETAARAAAAAVAAVHPGWWIAPAPLLSSS